MTFFARYDEPAAGFATAVRLRRIVLAAGRLGAGEGGPAHLHHGEETMEVVAELDAGQIFPVRGQGGATRLVEVYRPDMPWSRMPPRGSG